MTALVRSRIAADGFLIAGQAAFWRLVGLGFIAFGVGAAVGIAFYGYSYITRSEENLINLSSAFSRALSEVQLHATAQGSVQLQPNELTLAKGQTVSLDSNSRVLLDPTSKVLADGEMRVHAPTISAPQSVTPRSAPTAPIISNFTVFKAVPFGEGDVMTGWIFLTSTQKLPTHQYCYYTVHADTPGLNVSLDLGDDERPETPDYEIHHLIPLCLGGSDDPSNLWAQPRRSIEKTWECRGERSARAVDV